jgi:hypothetical protein
MYAANLIAMLDALDSGITTLVDWSHNNNTPEHADAAIQGVLDAGIRCVWAYGNSNDEWLPVSDKPQSRDVARIATQWFSSRDQLVTLALAPRGPQFATKEVTIRDFGLARELDIPVTVHVGDGAWGKSLPVLWLDKHGFADSRTTYVHCNMLSDDEFDVIARTGGAISIAPELEMHMGHGRLATLRARDRAIPVSLSIDVCTSVGGDMFSAMRALLAGTRYLVNVGSVTGWGPSPQERPPTSSSFARTSMGCSRSTIRLAQSSSPATPTSSTLSSSTAGWSNGMVSFSDTTSRESASWPKKPAIACFRRRASPTQATGYPRFTPLPKDEQHKVARVDSTPYRFMPVTPERVETLRSPGEGAGRWSRPGSTRTTCPRCRRTR